MEMSLAFTRISRWMWNRKTSEAPKPSPNSSADFSSRFRESESVKFPPANSRKVRQKRKNREERRMDKEYDAVLVPSDGVSMSGSESDESDWSIGWLESHAPEFQSGNDTDNTFAVLAPCYGNGSKPTEGRLRSKDEDLDTVIYRKDVHSDKKHIEEWLSSLELS